MLPPLTGILVCVAVVWLLIMHMQDGDGLTRSSTRTGSKVNKGEGCVRMVCLYYSTVSVCNRPNAYCCCCGGGGCCTNNTYAIYTQEVEETVTSRTPNQGLSESDDEDSVESGKKHYETTIVPSLRSSRCTCFLYAVDGFWKRYEEERKRQAAEEEEAKKKVGGYMGSKREIVGERVGEIEMHVVLCSLRYFSCLTLFNPLPPYPLLPLTLKQALEEAARMEERKKKAAEEEEAMKKVGGYMGSKRERDSRGGSGGDRGACRIMFSPISLLSYCLQPPSSLPPTTSNSKTGSGGSCPYGGEEEASG